MTDCAAAPAWQPVQPPQALLDFLTGGQRFLIAGHKDPDGDCAGSQLALSAFLRRMGKDVIVCSAGNFKRREVARFEKDFVTKIGEAEREDRRLVLVDCSSLERTGDLASSLKGLETAIIDHHAANEWQGEAVSYIDSRAPAAALLVLFVIEAMGAMEASAAQTAKEKSAAGKPTQEEASLLFLGLATDTGFFRHVDTAGEEVFKAASRLAALGASPKRTFYDISSGESLAQRKFLALMLSRAEPHFDGKLLYTYEDFEDREKFGIENRDSDNLYSLLQTVGGVEAVAVCRQEKPARSPECPEGECTVGLRSLDKVDVSRAAAGLGGGGHKNAAGASVKGVLSGVKNKIMSEFEKEFSRVGKIAAI